MTRPTLAVLLAGGESRRMGRDKCTTSVLGRPLYLRQLETLRATGPDSLAVVAPSRPDWAEAANVLWIPDALSPNGERSGPLGGIAGALARARGNVVFLPIDMPAITGEWLAEIAHLAPEGRAVIPIGPDGYEPLVAVYPAAAVALASAQLQSGDYSVRRWIDRLAAAGWVEATPAFSERWLFANLNRPADIVAWEDRQRTGMNG